MHFRITGILGMLFLLCWGSSVVTFAAGTTEHPVAAPPCAKAAEHYVTVDKLRLHYLETGNGPTLVLIHGNPGDGQDFTFSSVGLLCGEYRIVAVDRTGHGKSERLGGKAATLDYQAGLLHQALQQIGVTKPILVGHSWGGAMALEYALKYEDSVSGLVLLAPAAYEDKDVHKFMRVVTSVPLVGDASLWIGKSLFGRHVLKQELAHAFSPEPVPNEYLKMTASSWLTMGHIKAYLQDEWTLNASLKTLSQRYTQIHVPVVIVTGDQDKIVPVKENAYRLKTAIPQAQLIELKSVGHEIPQAHPEVIVEAMKLICAAGAVAGCQ